MRQTNVIRVCSGVACYAADHGYSRLPIELSLVILSAARGLAKNPLEWQVNRIVIPNRFNGEESAFQFRSSAVRQFRNPLCVSALGLGFDWRL